MWCDVMWCDVMWCDVMLYVGIGVMMVDGWPCVICVCMCIDGPVSCRSWKVFIDAIIRLAPHRCKFFYSTRPSYWTCSASISVCLSVQWEMFLFYFCFSFCALLHYRGLLSLLHFPSSSNYILTVWLESNNGIWRNTEGPRSLYFTSPVLCFGSTDIISYYPFYILSYFALSNRFLPFLG